MRATVATSRRGVATRGVTRRRGRMARRVKLATASDPKVQQVEVRTLTR